MQESTVCRGISMEEDEPVFPDDCFPTTPPVTTDLKKHPEPKGCPVGDSSSIGSHPSRLLHPPVPGLLQKDPVTSGNLSNHMIQVPKLYPDLPLSSNAQLETGSQMCEEPSWKSSFHMSLSAPVHSEVQMQTRPPHHLSCVSKWSLQGSQSHLFSQEAIRQTRQCVSDLTDLYTPGTPQWTPVPSSPDSRLPIHQDLPTMGVTSSPNHQMLSRSCTSSASEVSSGSTFLPHQVLNAGPRKQRKERTVYTKEQKLLLQEHFKQCMYPSSDRCKELARIVGVTEREIKIWFKNNRARYRLNEKRQPDKF